MNSNDTDRRVAKFYYSVFTPAYFFLAGVIVGYVMGKFL